MANIIPLTDFEPDWAVPPGATIAAILSARALSREGFAASLGESLETVHRLLLGHEIIDIELANKLALCLGSSKDFWLAREAQYRKDAERVSETKQSNIAKSWVRQFPVREMAALGWIKPSRTLSDAAKECLSLFGVPDVSAWQSRYGRAASSAAFRMSASVKSNPGAVTAWLRWAEIIAEQTPCQPWNPELFRARLESVRRLTWQKDPAKFMPKLRQLCAEAGVAVVVARTPKGCPASGATQFLNKDKAIMVLSFRYRSDDHFWFTFFHEAGHLLLHGPDALFLEDESEVTSDEEQEANHFAGEMLIPAKYYPEFLSLRIEKDEIIRFARNAGVAPGVVVGQLQHSKRIAPDRMNWLKRRYDWDQIETDKIIP